MDEQTELNLELDQHDHESEPEADPKDAVIAELQQQITVLQGQVTAMEHFGNIVIGQRNEAQTEAAKLRTQLALRGEQYATSL